MLKKRILTIKTPLMFTILALAPFMLITGQMLHQNVKGKEHRKTSQNRQLLSVGKKRHLVPEEDFDSIRSRYLENQKKKIKNAKSCRGKRIVVFGTIKEITQREDGKILYTMSDADSQILVHTKPDKPETCKVNDYVCIDGISDGTNDENELIINNAKIMMQEEYQ